MAARCLSGSAAALPPAFGLGAGRGVDDARAYDWPLSEQSWHFDLGHVLNCAVTDAIGPARVGTLGVHHAGLWECAIPDETLVWSGGVYDLFGLPRGLAITRACAVSHYCEDSRARLEKLRAHAIQHKRGFTLDAEIHARAVGERRRIRIIAAPVCEGGTVIRLTGIKLAV
jgi:hypothetical protein